MSRNFTQRLIAFFYLMIPAALFAQDIVPAGMASLMDNMVKVFTGPIVRAILIIILCGCAIAYAFNKDNEQMKRKIIAIGISIAIIVGASGIVDVIWSASE